MPLVEFDDQRLFIALQGVDLHCLIPVVSEGLRKKLIFFSLQCVLRSPRCSPPAV